MSMSRVLINKSARKYSPPVLGPYALEQLTEQDLELVRNWRNSDHVKRWMLTRDYITSDNQRKWFFARQGRDDFIFRHGRKKIGLVYLFNQNETHRFCEFGFYIGDKQYLRSGVGAVMEFMALDLVFVQWRYHRIWQWILPANKKTIRMHERFGFQPEGLLRKHIKGPHKYIDVMVQGLLREEWLARRKKIYNSLNAFYHF